MTKFNPKSAKQLLTITIYIFIATFSFWLMHSTFQAKNGQLIIASKAWSDFAAHVPLIRSFSYGNNFPPEYPTFPGEPIKYHFLMYAAVGVMESIGINIATGLNLISSLGFALLLYFIFRLTKTIFNHQAAILALALFLFNGSLSFIEFFKNHPLNINTITDITTATNFASFGPWDESLVSAFWNLNIYTNQRHLGLGFGLLLATLFPIINHLYRQQKIHAKHFIISLIIILLLPFIHQAAFVALLIILTSILIFYYHHRSITRYIICLLAATVPGLIYLLIQQNSHIAFQPGFLAASINIVDMVTYWFYNFGIYLIIIPLIFIKTSKNNKRLLLSFAPLFILAHIFKFTPDMINNHKFINIFMVVVVIFTSGWIIKLWQDHTAIKPVIILIILSLTLSGIIDFFPIYNDYALTLNDISRSDTASWIVRNTPPDSVFLTTTYLYHPASLAGRKTWLDYGYFNWSLGYNDAVRKKQLPLLFSSSMNMPDICTQLENNHINYVMISAGNGEIPNVDPHQSTLAKTSTPLYTSKEGHQIYQVSRICL